MRAIRATATIAIRARVIATARWSATANRGGSSGAVTAAARAIARQAHTPPMERTSPSQSVPLRAKRRRTKGCSGTTIMKAGLASITAEAPSTRQFGW